jgi:hypothetical protein
LLKKFGRFGRMRVSSLLALAALVGFLIVELVLRV